MDALDGRRLSRLVLGDLASRWAAIWDEALAVQSRNPDMLRLALTKTTDPEAAIVDIIPHLALLHPRVTASVAAFCHGVADELGYDAPGDPVVGVEYNRGVDGDEMGRPADVDRLAQVEQKCERIEGLIARLLNDPAAVERLRSMLRSDRADGRSL